MPGPWARVYCSRYLLFLAALRCFGHARALDLNVIGQWSIVLPTRLKMMRERSGDKKTPRNDSDLPSWAIAVRYPHC